MIFGEAQETAGARIKAIEARRSVFTQVDRPASDTPSGATRTRAKEIEALIVPPRVGEQAAGHPAKQADV